MRNGILSAIAVLGLSSSPAFANSVSVDLTGSIAGYTTYFGAYHTDNIDFTDTFSVNLTGPWAVSVSLTTVGDGAHNIDFVSADINGNALTLSPTGFLENGGTVSTLSLTGPLVLTVHGKSDAAGGVYASYAGTLNLTQIVPAPAALWTMGSGLLALLGLRRARR